MSGAANSVKKVLGLPRQDGGQGTVADQMKDVTKPAEKPAAQAAAEDTAARRRARRGGRALLSEARIAPETGLQQTLGTGV
jgi:hypothetical protein